MTPQRHRISSAVAGIFALVVAIGLLTSHHVVTSRKALQWPFGSRTAQLHLLLPATATNLNLCKLLLSATITGYPTPTLLGWEGHGQYNGTESHLFKISETLAYLDKLPASADDDLVLVLDAYDVWLQLPPDVLIKRYFSAIDKANARLKSEGIHGVEHGGAVVKQSILFGPDKTCWPDDERRAACWAVPESSLPKDIFGPATDTWMVPNRPRWLNSGTIMGPTKDMRAMFSATLSLLHRKYDPTYPHHNSDQFYFQEMWAEQELNRLKIKPQSDGALVSPPPGVQGIVPSTPADQRTEFHVALDYESAAFQTSAAYTEYLAWMRFNHSSTSAGASGPLARTRRMDQFALSQDILDSRAPFAGVAARNSDSNSSHIAAGDDTLSWNDVPLGTNTATQRVFPVWHMTGEKSYRARWWPRMWFHGRAEALLEARRREAGARGKGGRERVVVARVGGVGYVDGGGGGGDVGAWTDRGDWLGWEALCGGFGEGLFAK